MREISEHQLHEIYDEMLDLYSENDGTVEIAGYRYSVSYALKHVDPVAYRCGFNDWLDAEISDGAIIEENDIYYEPGE